MHRDAIQSLCISLRPNEFGLNLTFSRVLYLLFPQPSIYSLSLSLSLRTVFLQLREWSISWPRQPSTQGSIPSCSAGSPLGGSFFGSVCESARCSFCVTSAPKKLVLINPDQYFLSNGLMSFLSSSCACIRIPQVIKIHVQKHMLNSLKFFLYVYIGNHRNTPYDRYKLLVP